MIRCTSSLTLLAVATWIVSLAAQTVIITRAGSRAVRPGPAANFTGDVRVEMLFEARDPSQASGGSVTFAPGARTAWHSHPRGQILIVTAGTGRVQLWGDAVQEIRAGDIVRIPAAEKHWHGASPQESMTHIAITEHRDGAVVVEPTRFVAARSQPRDGFGAHRHRKDGAARGPSESSAGEWRPAVRSVGPPRASGDLLRLAERRVGARHLRSGLYRAEDRHRHAAGRGSAPAGSRVRRRACPECQRGIWRDRAEVHTTHQRRRVQLDLYLRRGVESGLTREQIIEALTHLGFYAGWPKATRAITAASRSLGH
jgi:4-carboxymuconolactone decarboxylase